MTATLVRALLLPAAALSLLSCGGNGGEPMNAMTAGQILGNFNNILKAMPRSGTVNLPMAGATLDSKVTTMAIDCETVTPNPIVDADGDDIAAEKTSKFDCTDSTVGGSKLTRIGSYTVKDEDDSVDFPEKGFSVDFAVTKFNSTNTSDSSETDNSYVGKWVYTGSGGSLKSTSEFDGHYRYYSPADSYDIDYDYNYTWSWTSTPTNAAAPWDAGSQDFSGSYSLSGKFMAEDGQGNHFQQNGTWVISYKSKDLKYDQAGGCTFYYRSGSIVINDGNSDYEIRYACNSADLYVNGEKSDIWTVQ
ncbi:MAG: hypothetical protein KF799_07370 [Bdellovibrionales bacterium]|nr:hypothetical protein [Bdellovibrionales bacterium]